MPGEWSQAEVEAVVTDYFTMLSLELRRERYNKAAHRRKLIQLLNGRSDGAVERKHQNISAILMVFGYPYIFGYKPLGNYQSLLHEVVADRISSDSSLSAIVQQAVDEPATISTVEDWLSRLDSPPEPYTPASTGERSEPLRRVRPVINYLEREARNASLGRAGEEFVLNFERARLIRLGQESLADRVEHIAVTEGDEAGFDVRSFEADGRDRFIEVKTTAYGKQVPFFVSQNEVMVSQNYSDHYHLYRVFRFRDDPRLFTLTGALDHICNLSPVQFIARIA